MIIRGISGNVHGHGLVWSSVTEEILEVHYRASQVVDFPKMHLTL